MKSEHAQKPISKSERLTGWVTHYWVWAVCLILGVYVGLPWLAPIFMKLGWTGAGNLIYALYSTQCHQLPQRSFFLFGPKTMVSLTEIQTVWQNTDNPFFLRQFIGNAEMGWKVAWSDRMVFMYSSIIMFAFLIFVPRRETLKPIPWWVFLLLLLPMAVDGGSHFLSDLSGIGNGFRDSNGWLAFLTGYTLPVSFYAGDALGSFNSWMRLITGLFFGLAVVLFLFPTMKLSFQPTMDKNQADFQVQ